MIGEQFGGIAIPIGSIGGPGCCSPGPGPWPGWPVCNTAGCNVVPKGGPAPPLYKTLGCPACTTRLAIFCGLSCLPTIEVPALFQACVCRCIEAPGNQKLFCKAPEPDPRPTIHPVPTPLTVPNPANAIAACGKCAGRSVEESYEEEVIA